MLKDSFTKVYLKFKKEKKHILSEEIEERKIPVSKKRFGSYKTGCYWVNIPSFSV